MNIDKRISHLKNVEINGANGMIRFKALIDRMKLEQSKKLSEIKDKNRN